MNSPNFSYSWDVIPIFKILMATPHFTIVLGGQTSDFLNFSMKLMEIEFLKYWSEEHY